MNIQWPRPRYVGYVALFSRSVFRPLSGLNVRNYREFRTSHVYETCPYYFLRLLPLHLGCLQFIFIWICPRFLVPFLVSLLSFLLSELPSLSPTLCTPFCNTRHSLMSRRFYSPYCINHQIIVAITSLYRVRTMCYESEACSQGFGSLSA